MKKSFLTFGWGHKHPQTGVEMKDYWIELYYLSFDKLKESIYRIFGNSWSQTRPKESFDPSYYPKGRYTTIIVDKVPRITKYNKYGRNRITNKRKTFQRSRLQQN